MSKVININEFRNFVGENNDMAMSIFNAISACKNEEETILSFPKDIYHVHYNKCYEEYLFISNHDHGLKKMAFPLINLQNIIIDGNGSEFIFHGRVTPFAINKSKNVTIKNLSIDYIRPFFTQGEVIEANHEQVTLKINSEKYPFYIEDDMIHYYSEDGWENTYMKWFIEFDPKRKAPAYAMGGSDVRAQKVKAELIEKDIVRFSASFREKHTIGNMINITTEQRYNPGIFINESENITLENIHIYHAGAMGVIAQTSKNITLKNVNIGVREGSDRIVSTNNDATHFVNCEGLLKLENCTFMHQLDDGTNIHGIYTMISKVYSEDIIEVELMHFQQYGINTYRIGDEIAFVDKETHLEKGYAMVKDVILINQKFIRLQIEVIEGAVCKEGDCVSNYQRMPEVIIRNCNFGDNRARGILASTNKKVIIENNNFFTSGSSICCGGEMEDWFESGPIKDITVKNNVFNNCGYAKWGLATISMNTKLKNPLQKEYVNSNFRIIGNEFNTFESPIVYTLSLNGFEFYDNKITHTTAFLPFKQKEYYLDINSSDNIIVINNTIKGICENTFINDISKTKFKKVSENKFLD